jgi:DNA polymerase III subunit delta
MASYTQKNIENLFNEIRQSKRAPVYLLFGEEFLVKKAASRLVDLLMSDEQKGFSLQVVDGDQERAFDTVETLNTFSLFEAAKVVWVKNSHAFDSKSTAKDLLKQTRQAYFDGDRTEAARRLARVLGSLGWTTEDIAGGRLRSLNEKEWQEALGGEKTPQEIKWIEDLSGFMKERDMQATSAGNGSVLEEAVAAGFAGDNTLVLTCLSVNKRSRLYKEIERRGSVVDLALAAGAGKKARNERQDVIVRQINAALKAAGKSMDPPAMALFLTRVGEDLQLVSQELEKLVAYVGERDRVHSEDVEEVVSLNSEAALYEIMDAVGDRDAPRALRLLKRLLDQSFHLLQIQSVLVRKVRQLVWAKGFTSTQAGSGFTPDISFAIFQKTQYKNISEQDRAVVGSMAPYPAYKLFQQARRFSMEELVQAMEWLLEADVKLKSGALEPERWVESVLLKLCLGNEDAGGRGRRIGRP